MCIGLHQVKGLQSALQYIDTQMATATIAVGQTDRSEGAIQSEPTLVGKNTVTEMGLNRKQLC